MWSTSDPTAPCLATVLTFSRTSGSLLTGVLHLYLTLPGLRGQMRPDPSTSPPHLEPWQLSLLPQISAQPPLCQFSGLYSNCTCSDHSLEIAGWGGGSGAPPSSPLQGRRGRMSFPGSISPTLGSWDTGHPSQHFRTKGQGGSWGLQGHSPQFAHLLPVPSHLRPQVEFEEPFH